MGATLLAEVYAGTISAPLERPIRRLPKPAPSLTVKEIVP
jgi:hypothetical protein